MNYDTTPQMLKHVQPHIHNHKIRTKVQTSTAHLIFHKLVRQLLAKLPLYQLSFTD